MISGLRVASSRYSFEDWPEFPYTYTKKSLPADKEDVSKPSKFKQWRHLERILD